MKALAYGQIIWDEIPDGQGGIDRRVGGATFNAAAHLAELGNDVYLLTALGEDALGNEAAAEMTARKVHAISTRRSKLATGCVRLEMDRDNQPRYMVDDSASWDDIRIDEQVLNCIRTLNFDVLFYGTIEQRSAVSRQTLRTLVENVSFPTVYVDLTLRAPYYDAETVAWSLAHCNVAKMNRDEMKETDQMLHLNTESMEAFSCALADRFGIRAVIVTDGEKGAWCCEEGRAAHIPASPTRLVNPIGAGDAFFAGMIDKLEKGDGLVNACRFGTRLASAVCSLPGALPEKEATDQ